MEMVDKDSQRLQPTKDSEDYFGSYSFKDFDKIFSWVWIINF